jgi:hypothetical protein
MGNPIEGNAEILYENSTFMGTTAGACRSGSDGAFSGVITLQSVAVGSAGKAHLFH